MLSRNQVKYINSLKLKKQREKYRQFIAEGSKIVLDLLDSGHHVCEIYATGDWIDQYSSSFQLKNIHPVQVTEDELSRVTALTTPSPVLSIVSIPETDAGPVSGRGKLILALDDIRDPGNLGTIIRIADWFGISSVVCSESTVDLYNPKVVQATMGSIARVPVHSVNLENFLSGLPPSLNIYGSFLEGENIYVMELHKEGIIIIGNESTGISDGVARFVTHRVHIPSFSTGRGSAGQAESLNASVATAVLCSEFKRRIL